MYPAGTTTVGSNVSTPHEEWEEKKLKHRTFKPANQLNLY